MPGSARREVRDDDAIAGVRPRLAFAPDSLEQAAEVMAMLARERAHVGFVGNGTSRGLGAPPRALDAVIATERMARVLEHAPADMVVIAEAGCTIAEVQAHVGAHGQRLAIDPPLGERATIGGLIATAGFGPLRARYGGVRDLLIGATMIRADGEIARGGGKVVKNVAGFDLPKLLCGSLGTLGMIASAAFRLHPRPEAIATVYAPRVRAEDVVALVAVARAAQLEPARVVATTPGVDDPNEPASFELAFAFEGFARGVADQAARLRAASKIELVELDAAAAAAFWRRHAAVRGAGPLRAKLTGLPTHLPAIAPLATRLGAFTWYPTVGVGFAGGELDDASTIAALTAARAAILSDGGSVVIETAPLPVHAAVDAWGPAPPGFEIMRRLKHRFDPEGRLNPGRFVGGL